MSRIPLFLALALAACAPAPDADLEHAMSMQSYTVPDGAAPEVVGTLNRLLRAHVDDPIGRAEVGPAGDVIVVAPESVQRGVAQVIGGLATSAPPRAPDNIAMQYWLFTGTPAAETTKDPRLAEIDVALDAIVAADGPMRFEPIGEQTLRALAGDEARLEMGGDDATAIAIRQVAAKEPRGDGLVADIHLDLWRGRVKTDTRLSLRADQTGVLSEVGNLSRAEGQWATLYTVIRPRIAPAG